MHTVDRYLKYLQESEGIHEAKFDLAGEVVGGLKSGLRWGLLVIPAGIAAWKLANVAFSQAIRKCGGIRQATPGFKVCVARERIKALNQKINAANQILAQCNKSKNPELCRQTFQLEIEKAKNRIAVNQNKIRETLVGEQQNLQEFLPALASLAVVMAAQTVVDKAIFVVNRTAQSLFSQAVRKCGVYKDSPERNLCMAKAKLSILQQKLTKLNQLKTQCANDKNPASCNEKLQKNINKVLRDIQIEKDNITAFTNQIELEKREEALKQQMKAEKKAAMRTVVK